jgi:hypothetical protein
MSDPSALGDDWFNPADYPDDGDLEGFDDCDFDYFEAAPTVNNEVMRSPVTLTVIDAIRPSVLSKRFSLAKDGSLEKHTGGHLEEGRAYKAGVCSAAAFADVLASLKPHHALMHGVFPHDDAIVVSKRRLEQSQRQKRDLPVVTRSKDCVI